MVGVGGGVVVEESISCIRDTPQCIMDWTAARVTNLCQIAYR